jgi:hypothetical protein
MLRGLTHVRLVLNRARTNMFYGVTVLEGEAKRVCSLDLGRGKYNESN